MPDELIVTFRPGPLRAPAVGSITMTSAGTAETVGRSIRSALVPHERPGLTVRGVSPAILAARMRLDDAAQLEAMAAELRGNPAVATVERNPIVRLENTAARLAVAPPVRPVDPLFPWQAWHYEIVDLHQAWNITTGSASVLVAVVDDGIRFDHPDIAANMTSDGYDFASDFAVPVCSGGDIGNAGDGDGYDPDPTQPASYDFVGGCVGDLRSSGNHGLHVAGTVGALSGNAMGGTGVNWSVQIRPVRVLGVSGSGINYDVAQGILYAAGLPADDGAGGTVQAPSAARVINLSLGGPSPSTDLENAVIAADGAGAIIVAAAGNSATSDPHYPAAYPQTVSVSAIGPDGSLASYSNFGSTIDIAAPGGELSLGTDFGVISTTWDFVSNSAIWDSWQGTSMAAPHVSGVAALMLAADPSLTGSQLLDRLVSFAVDLGAAGRDYLYGNGLVNARNSLTQSFEPAHDLYVRLIDASTGAVVQAMTAQADGSYAFNELPDGDYLVYAGQDFDGDQLVGYPGRRWGAFGGSATPSQIPVSGAGTYSTSFSIGLAVEVEPNDGFGTTNALAIDGYAHGTIATSLSDVDVFRVLIPTSGQYTFETSAWIGACGFALGENTILQLYDGSGVLIVENDDVDAANLNFCSRITQTLSPGTYYVAVWGWNALPYRVHVRSGG